MNTKMTIQEKLYDLAEIDALPSSYETALAVMDGDPEVLLDAVLFYLHHNPQRWEEIADFHRIKERLEASIG